MRRCVWCGPVTLALLPTGNNIAGALTAASFPLPQLTALELGMNALTAITVNGSDLAAPAALPALQKLDLSYNNISGTLPCGEG